MDRTPTRFLMYVVKQKSHHMVSNGTTRGYKEHTQKNYPPPHPIE